MKTLEECIWDHYFARVDAGELIPIPLPEEEEEQEEEKEEKPQKKDPIPQYPGSDKDNDY